MKNNNFIEKIQGKALIFKSNNKKESHVYIYFFGRFENDKPLLPTHKISQDKAKSLGISFTPLEVTLGDTIESLKEKGFLTV